MEPSDVEDVDSDTERHMQKVKKLGLCTWDMRYQALRFSGVGELVSIADFKAKCVRHLEGVASEARITHNLSSIPPGPVRDFGFTEMLDVSLDELKTVQEECEWVSDLVRGRLIQKLIFFPPYSPEKLNVSGSMENSQVLW